MSRLEINVPNRATVVLEQLYKDMERRIESSPFGLCPIDMSKAFLEMCHAQSCGKCSPCRIGLGQRKNLMEDVLEGRVDMGTLELILILWRLWPAPAVELAVADSRYMTESKWQQAEVRNYISLTEIMQSDFHTKIHA